MLGTLYLIFFSSHKRLRDNIIVDIFKVWNWVPVKFSSLSKITWLTRGRVRIQNQAEKLWSYPPRPNILHWFIEDSRTRGVGSRGAGNRSLIGFIHGSQNVGTSPLTSPGVLLEMQILKPHPRPPAAEPPGGGAQPSNCLKPSSLLKFENRWPISFLEAKWVLITILFFACQIRIGKLLCLEIETRQAEIWARILDIYPGEGEMLKETIPRGEEWWLPLSRVRKLRQEGLKEDESPPSRVLVVSVKQRT